MASSQESLELATLRQRVGLLLAKMHSGSEEEMASACSTLAVLASKPEMQSSLRALGTLGAVNELLYHDPEIVRASCASVIGSIARHQGNKAAVWESGCSKGLIAILRGENSTNTKVVAAGALRNISSFENAQLALYNDGVVPLLVELISTDSLPAKNAAIATIANISWNPEVRSLLTNTSVIDVLIRELSNVSNDCSIHVNVINTLLTIACESKNLMRLTSQEDLHARLVALFTTTPPIPDAGLNVVTNETIHISPECMPFQADIAQTILVDTPPPAPVHVTASQSPVIPSTNDRNITLLQCCGRLLLLLLSSNCLSLPAPAKSDLLRTLVAYISEPEGDSIILELSMLMVSTMSLHASLHDDILSAGALAPIVGLLRRKDVSETTSSAALATLTHLGVLDAPPVIDDAYLASLGSDQERKQAIGERLYRLVEQTYPVDASFLTGILLRLENTELLQMLVTPEHLRRRMEGAMSALVSLRQSDGKTKTLSSLETQAPASSGKDSGKFRRKPREEDRECL